MGVRKKIKRRMIEMRLNVFQKKNAPGKERVRIGEHEKKAGLNKKTRGKPKPGKDIKKPDLKGKKLFAKKKRKRRFSIRGFAKTINLQEYLEKAGLKIDANILTKKIFKLNIFLCLALSIIVIVLNIVSKKGVVNLLVFLLGFWLTVFFFLLALLWLIYLFYIDMRIFKRTKEVEAVFPDFLQLASSNISAGMPVDRALWYAVRPGFGVLAKEIETVAKNTMAGEDLSVALTNFGKKYNSKVIQRSISLLLEGMAAGGEMADLLNKIALNIEETRILRKEMAASVTTYVIFITFATIIAAPVLFGLATQLLEVIKEITSRMSSTMQSSSTFFSFSISSGGIKISDFTFFAYLMLIISSISSACIISVIRKGRVKEGLTRIPLFIIVSIILYTLASLLMKGMFNSLL